MQFEGRTWVFGDNMNTDLMYPNTSFKATEDERRRLVFSANRPGWSSQVAPGDVLIGGVNFGTGSGRPGAKYLKELGVVALLAESINGLFLRNCVNYALPAMECPGIASLATEGDVVSVDFATGVVTNRRTGQTRQAATLPPMLRDILEAGGILEILANEGYIDLPRTVPIVPAR
jgi:3-isopropylmalate/(R)-2-methylmalate dehydratase small subunit